MNPNEEGRTEEVDPEEVSAIDKWIDEGNPNAWDPRMGFSGRPRQEEEEG
jgi:hypothetical protein